MISQRTWSRAAVALAAVGALVVAGDVAQAQPILDVGGFEPAFNYTTTFLPPGGYAGQLEGQAPLGSPGPFNGTWRVPAGGTGTSTATVTAGIGVGGSQAVSVFKGDTDARWGVPTGPFPSQGRRYICIEWDQYVPSPGSGGVEGTDFGPFLGVETNNDQTGSPFGRHALLGIDATSGTILVGAAGSGAFAGTDTSAVAAFDTWYNFRLELDFATATSRSYLDGVLIDTEGFIDAGASEFTDADIAALSEGDPSLTATAYFDNFTIVEKVPEPASILLAGLGMAALGFRKRLIARG